MWQTMLHGVTVSRWKRLEMRGTGCDTIRHESRDYALIASD